ncbi:MAG: hypothetical protein ACO1SV_17950 [Fimbriimonas sp.]
MHVNQTDYRPIDKIVGIILAVLSGCGVLCGGGILLGMGVAFGSLAGSYGGAMKGADAPPPAVGAGALALGGLFAFAFFVIFSCYVLNIVGAIGVMKSRRWGFMLTAILTGISSFAALSGATLYLDILPTLAVCIYCVLRLTGNLGTAPD